MAETEAAEETYEDMLRAREVTLSRYPGREPVTVRTSHVPGEVPSREKRIRAGMRRMLQEGRLSLVD